jgi:hypothetical protein
VTTSVKFRVPHMAENFLTSQALPSQGLSSIGLVEGDVSKIRF